VQHTLLLVLSAVQTNIGLLVHWLQNNIQLPTVERKDCASVQENYEGLK